MKGGIIVGLFRKFFDRDTIRKQLQSWTIFFAIILSLIILIPTIYIEYHQSRMQIDKDIQANLYNQAYFFNHWLEERSKDIHTLSQLDIVRNYQLEEAKEYFHIVRNEKSHFADLVLVNKDGFVEFDTVERSNDEKVVIDVNEREYFKIAKETMQPHIADVMISLVTKVPIVIFASPILDDNNDFNGVVFGTVNLSTIDTLFQESGGAFIGRTYVVNQDRIILSELKRNKNIDSYDSFVLEESIFQNVKKMAQNESEIFRGIHGDYVFGGSKLVNNGSWYLISEINILEVYSPYVKKFILLISSIFIGILLTARLMLYLAQKIEQPIKQLLYGVRNMERGNYDYKINQEDIGSSAKEFLELCSAFNRMSEKVRDNVDVLEELTTICQLTKLYNRRYLMEHGQQLFYNCVNEGAYCSCIIVDIDYFKSVNDTYGHIVGDQVLSYLAKILSTSVRSTDIVTRYGGEEFVILSPYSSLENSLKIAERIRGNIQKNPFITEKFTIYLTVSIGVAEYKADPEIKTFFQLFEKADKALYEAKENGRNQIRMDKDAISF